MHSLAIKSLLTALAATSLLAACGGGGSSAPSTSSTPSASQPTAPSTAAPTVSAPSSLTTLITGVFDGKSDNGSSVTSILQDDGSYFMVFSESSGRLQSAVVGTGTLNNSSFSSSNGLDLNVGPGSGQTPAALTLSASYNFKQSFNGNISYTSGQTKSFVSTYNNSFETLPSLAAMVGSYTGSIVTNKVHEDNITLTITADGKLSGQLSCGCEIYAALAPRKDNLAYVATLVMSGGDHPLTGKSIAGNVYLDSVQKRLYIFGTLNDSTDHAIFVGTKS